MLLIETQRQRDLELLHRLEELAEMEGLRRVPEVYKVSADTLAEIHSKAEEADVLKADGSRILSADWDIGDGRMIQTDKIRARDGAGLCLYEDGGSGIFVEDGGNVGIGITDPEATLHTVCPGGSSNVLFESDSTYSEMAGKTYSSTNVSDRSIFTLARGRGSKDSKSAVADGDYLGELRFGGYGAIAGWYHSASILAIVNGTVSLNKVPTDLSIETGTGAGGLNTEAVRITSTQLVGLGISTPAAKLHIDQSSTTEAKPVLTLDQADVSEEFIRFIGSAASGVLTQSIVDNGDVGTATLVGWAKVYAQDDGDQISDSPYYLPLYTLSA